MLEASARESPELSHIVLQRIGQSVPYVANQRHPLNLTGQALPQPWKDPRPNAVGKDRSRDGRRAGATKPGTGLRQAGLPLLGVETLRELGRAERRVDADEAEDLAHRLLRSLGEVAAIDDEQAGFREELDVAAHLQGVPAAACVDVEWILDVRECLGNWSRLVPYGDALLVLRLSAI